MASTVLRANLTFGFTVSEDHGGAPAGVTIESPFSTFNDSLSMLPTDTPPAALLSLYKTTISGGGYTIDLTAAQGSNGNVNGTGKRIQAIRVSNPSASTGNVTIATGASNGGRSLPRLLSRRAVRRWCITTISAWTSTRPTRTWT